jgi:uncharacterized membrane protein YfcA
MTFWRAVIYSWQGRAGIIVLVLFVFYLFFGNRLPPEYVVLGLIICLLSTMFVKLPVADRGDARIDRRAKWVIVPMAAALAAYFIWREELPPNYHPWIFPAVIFVGAVYLILINAISRDPTARSNGGSEEHPDSK